MSSTFTYGHGKRSLAIDGVVVLKFEWSHDEYSIKFGRNIVRSYVGKNEYELDELYNACKQVLKGESYEFIPWPEGPENSFMVSMDETSLMYCPRNDDIVVYEFGDLAPLIPGFILRCLNEGKAMPINKVKQDAYDGHGWTATGGIRTPEAIIHVEPGKRRKSLFEFGLNDTPKATKL